MKIASFQKIDDNSISNISRCLLCINTMFLIFDRRRYFCVCRWKSNCKRCWIVIDAGSRLFNQQVNSPSMSFLSSNKILICIWHHIWYVEPMRLSCDVLQDIIFFNDIWFESWFRLSSWMGFGASWRYYSSWSTLSLPSIVNSLCLLESMLDSNWRKNVACCLFWISHGMYTVTYCGIFKTSNSRHFFFNWYQTCIDLLILMISKHIEGQRWTLSYNQ